MSIEEQIIEDLKSQGIKITVFTESYICECGNHTHSKGFHYCNEDGEYIDPDETWIGLFKCDECGQIIGDGGFIAEKIIEMYPDEDEELERFTNPREEDDWRYRG